MSGRPARNCWRGCGSRRAEMAREPKKTASRFRWRLWLGVAGVAVVCASSGLAALKVRDFAMHDPRFALSRRTKEVIRFEGIQYTSRGKLQRVFAPDFNHSIFSIPLD